MNTIRRAAVLSTMTLMLAASLARGQVLLYSNDFSSEGLGNASAQFALGDGVFHYVSGGGTIVSTASEPVDTTQIGDSVFVVSTRFTLNNWAGGGNLITVGFGLFGSSESFASSGGDSFYLADWGVNNHSSQGQVRILALGDSNGFSSASGDSDGGDANGSSVVIGATYELRLTGRYQDGALHMTLALFDEQGNQLGSSATATDTLPLAGQHFGYRNRTAGAAHVIEMDYHEFSVVVMDAELPLFVTHPSSQTWLAGQDVTFTMEVTGLEPFAYQWRHDGEPIPEATHSTYTIPDAQPAHSGNYSVEVSNILGSATSSTAVLTILPRVEHGVLTRLWSLAPGDRDYLTTTDVQRGLACNPLTGNVLLVNRADGVASVHVLDGGNGEDKGELITWIVGGGTFPLNLIGVAEDGVVYAANLTTDSVNNDFKIYRWDNDDPSTMPAVAFLGAPGELPRWGDTFAVRGAGEDTQIIMSSLNRNSIAVFTTADGLNFNPTVMEVADAPSGAFNHGLDFGDGNTFWGKARNGTLRRGSFDLSSGTATVLDDYGSHLVPDVVGPIGVHPDKALLAGVAAGALNHIQVYSIAHLESGPLLVEEAGLPANNANIRNSGAASFANDRLYVLSTANGIAAFQVNEVSLPFPLTAITVAAGMVALEWGSVAGQTYQVQHKNNLSDPGWLEAGPPVTAAGSSAGFSEAVNAEAQRFYRVLLLP